jgi:hypothetical protein
MISHAHVREVMDGITKSLTEQMDRACGITKGEAMIALGISFSAACRASGMNPRKVLQSITDEHGDTLDAVSKHPARTV